ncbi:MAG: hypothetical protein WCN27_02150, partial [Alphaproteobacteria bacterium]
MRKHLLFALLIVMPIATCASVELDCQAGEFSAHGDESSLPPVYHEMIEILDAFEAKERDMLAFTEEVQAKIAQGKQPVEINPFFESMSLKGTSEWCNLSKECTLRNLESIRSDRIRAREALISKDGIRIFFEEKLRAYLGYLQSREDGLREIVDQNEVKGCCFISTIPGSKLSNFNMFIRQGTIDRFHFLSLMLKALYTHAEKRGLSWNAKTFLKSTPGLKNFFDGKTSGDFDLNLDLLVLKNFRSYKKEVEKKEIDDQLRRSGCLGMAVHASLDPMGRVVGIPHGLDMKTRLQIILQLKQQQKALDGKDESQGVQDGVKTDGNFSKAPKKKKKNRNKKKKPVAAAAGVAAGEATSAPDRLVEDGEEEDAAVVVGHTSESATTSAPDRLVEEEDEEEAAMVENHTSASAAGSEGAPYQEPVEEEKEDAVVVDHPASAASIVLSAIGASKNTAASAHSISYRESILRGRARDYFDSFWDPYSTGAGLNFDKEFRPLFEHLGGRIKFA